MQRVRRDSASSTDSWSIIEQRCSPEISEEVLDSDECGSDSELEIGEEAFDSHDSDIEVEEENVIDEEEERSEIDEEEASEDEEEEEQSENESEEEQENDETPEWGLVSQKEAMSGEGKHFVNPEKIKSRFDTVIERRDNSQKVALFLKISFACFVIQNIALLASLILSRPIYYPSEVKESNQLPSPSATSFKPIEDNISASPLCWSSRASPRQQMSDTRFFSQSGRSEGFEIADKNMTKYNQFYKPKGLFYIPSGRHIYLTKEDYLKTVRKNLASVGYTTISRQRIPTDICKKEEILPTTTCSVYPCHQRTPMPTPPTRKETKSAFSALKNIIEQSYASPKVKTSPKPRARSFNYKLEVPAVQTPPKGLKVESQKKMASTPMCPALPRKGLKERLNKMGKTMKKSGRTHGRSGPVPPQPKQVKIPPQEKKLGVSNKKCQVKAVSVVPKTKNEMTLIPKRQSKPRVQEAFVPKKMNVLKKRFSTGKCRNPLNNSLFFQKASQLMRNSSYYSHHHQCKREEFKQFKKSQLEDKSRRRRQRLLEYKVEKPCRAVYEEKKRQEKVVKKLDKLQARIQKKLQKIEGIIHKNRPFSA